MRRQVNLLISDGHAEADDYPIGMIWEEAHLVSERHNAKMATEAVLLQMAVSSLLGGGQAARNFNETIKRLTGNGEQS